MFIWFRQTAQGLEYLRREIKPFIEGSGSIQTFLAVAEKREATVFVEDPPSHFVKKLIRAGWLKESSLYLDE